MKKMGGGVGRGEGGKPDRKIENSDSLKPE